MALRVYKAAYGDLKVPIRFVVPTMKPWPRASRGMRLGKLVSDIRLTGRYISDAETGPDRRETLEDLGFVWRARARNKSEDEEETDGDELPPSTRSSAASTTTDGTSAQSSEQQQQQQQQLQVPLDQLYRALSAYREIMIVRRQSATGEDVTFWSVPAKFVIPDAKPWPESVRGMPLGHEAAQLPRRLARGTSKTKETFQKLGLSILAEQQREGQIDDGDLDKNPSSPQQQEQRQEEVQPKPQTKLSANDDRFQKVYTALKVYKELYGDLSVPQPFAVPKNDPQWPQSVWGLRLGARVNAIRSQGTFINSNPERRDMLDKLGFIWVTQKEGTRRRKRAEQQEQRSPQWRESEHSSEEKGKESSMESLFDESFDFGKDFDFMQDGEKSAPTWGLDLEGEERELQKVVRTAADEAAQAEEDYAPERSLEDSLKEAVERAKEAGIIEGLTPNQRVIKGKREKNIPWFNDDFGDDFVFEDVVEALTIYKSMYGNFTNLTQSDDFVVPAPKEITGFLDEDDIFGAFDIDASARAAAAIAKFEQEGDLDRRQELIASEIRRFQGEIGQVSSSAQSETLTTTLVAMDVGKDVWPEHLAGMCLGSIVERIRDGSLEVKHIPERKAQLDAIEFDWGDPRYFIDVPFEKAMCAMYAYYLVRGDMFVIEDFVMPDEDPWPQALAGFELGKAVTRLRQLQNFLEAYHPEKISLLRMIDFVWFPTMALPLDPNELEMDSEMLLLCAMGHPDYAKMIDIPMGLTDRIVADGPFFESDDPKQWWRTWHNWEYVKDYWYQQGRRDNAYVLRGMGYNKMADEHEAKYGPGLFQQINETLEELENGTPVNERTLDENRYYLEKLNFYRQELVGCTDIHPLDREEMIADFDARMLSIIKESDLDVNIEELNGLQKGADQESVDEDDVEDEYDDEEGSDDGSDDDLVADDFEVDIEEELGLDLQ